MTCIQVKELNWGWAMSGNKVEAFLALKSEGRPVVGRDRVALLEAVDKTGSITAAAKAVGLSYKAAWDALNAINNLLPRPAIVSQTGGKGGGGAVVTAEGYALITSFRSIEEKLSRVAEILSLDKSSAPMDPFALVWSLSMKTSARNAFRCTVEKVIPGSVNGEVLLRLSSATTLCAIITTESIQELGLTEGKNVIALVKSSFIMMAAGEEMPRISARNKIKGKIAVRDEGAVNTEIVLDIGDGKTIISIISNEGAREMDLKVGDTAWALFKSSHVILAVE